MKPAIRRGGAHDARAAADLYLRAREAALRAGSIPAGVHDDDDVRGYFASHIVEACELWVAEHDGALAGILVLDGEFIDQLYVEPGLHRPRDRQRPAGRRQARAPAGPAAVGLPENTGARRFYERHGFVEVRRTDGRDNEERAPDVLYAYRTGATPS